MINFKNDCVDAGFVLPNAMAEHVVVSWPQKTVEHAQYARKVRPGEIKLVDIGPSARNSRASLAGKKKNGNKENGGKKAQRKKAFQRKIKKKAGSVDIMDGAQQVDQKTDGLPRTQSNIAFNLFPVGRGFWKN